MNQPWLWLMLLGLLNDNVVDAFCNEANQLVKIAVVWDGRPPPALNWTETPRWEEALLQMNWPESFSHLRKFKQGRQELVLFKGKFTQCYKVQWDVAAVDDPPGLTKVFNQTVRYQLGNSTVIVGPYIKSVATLAAVNSIPYMITSPQPVSADPLHVTVPGDNTLLYMWPSWVDVARAVTDFLAGENQRKVLILYTGGSRTAAQVSQLIHNSIQDLNTIEYSGLTVIRYPDIPKKPDVPAPEQVHELDAIYKLINDQRVQTVVAFFDNKDPMWLLQQFFVQDRSLDRDDLTWLLVDQTMTYNSRMTQLERVRVLRSPIYNIVPSYLGKCLSLTDATNRMGAKDAMLALDTVLNKQLNPKDFTKQRLFEKLLNVNIGAKGAYSADPKDPFISSTVTLGWNMTFDADKHTRNNYEMQFRYLLPDAAVYGHLDDTCGRITSIWFSGRIPRGTGIESSYIRVREVTDQQSATSVVAVEDFPMVGLRYDPGNTLKGNERFEGVSVDIFREAAKHMASHGKRFKYNFVLEANNQYGRKDEITGKWSGLFGQIQEKNASIAIGHISKTTQRMREFSFTTSFGFVGLTYIVKRQPVENDWFPFLRPFEPLVWGGLIFTLALSGIFVHLLEWWNPYREPLVDESEPSLLSLRESNWYSYLTMTAIGAPYPPSTHATRTFSVFYWFFALLVVACYTGNLASFLTESRYRKPPGSLTDLLHQNELIYGTLSQSSNEDFFKNSPIITFRQMYKSMLDNDALVATSLDGLQRVKNSSYAMIGDSLLLDYYAGTDEDCELVAVQTGAADLTEVAFVADTRWPLFADFNTAIAELREDGTIRDIYQRWLSNTKTCKSDSEEEDNETAHLTFRSFHGLYLLLGLTAALSLIMLYLKRRHLHYKITREDKNNGSTALDVIQNNYAQDPTDVNDVILSDVSDVNLNDMNNDSKRQSVSDSSDIITEDTRL